MTQVQVQRPQGPSGKTGPSFDGELNAPKADEILAKVDEAADAARDERVEEILEGIFGGVNIIFGKCRC